MEEMSKKRILLTGGNGFIGRRICEECKNNGDDYLVIARNGQGETLGCKYAEADVLDKDAIRGVVSEYMPDVVIHLAGIAAPVGFDFSQLYQVNVLGTEYILDIMCDVLPKGSRFILTSTAGVYGNQAEKYLNEKLTPNPVNHYSFSKMIAEILTSHKSDYLETCIVRPFTVIGAGQSQRFFVPKLVKHFADRSDTIEVGNLDAVRDYVDVSYCAKIIYDLAKTEKIPGSILNICSGSEFSCRDVISMLETITGHHPVIKSTADFIRPNEIWRLVGDDSALKEFVNNRYACDKLETVLIEMLETESSITKENL